MDIRKYYQLTTVLTIFFTVVLMKQWWMRTLSVIAPILPSSSTTVALPSVSPVYLSLYRNGTYTGPVVDAYYGNVQIQAIVQNGMLVDIRALQYPRDVETSQIISGRALPLLRSEALRVQTADVDAVTGASETSAAFKQSLAAALLEAKVP